MLGSNNSVMQSSQVEISAEIGRNFRPFVVLGKAPIVAGDVLTAALIAWYLRLRGRSDAIVAFGVALYFLNPLVLYNGAFYGRFDAVCVGLI